jgi:signal transduction histidine kinase/ActR/RegA family two-component response regulator
VRYVLTALARPEMIRAVLTRQRLEGDWLVSILDAGGLRVARSRAHEETLGGRLTESAQNVIDGEAEEGFGRSYTVEGGPTFTVYSRLAMSGWVTAIGMPVHLTGTAASEFFAVYGIGVLLSLGLGTLAALWIARSITRPAAALRAAAESLGRRETPRRPDTSIQELREVGMALTAAGDERARRDAERDDLLRKERRAREDAEAASRAKEEFMAVLSHELRTPLNAVYGWARMLQSGQLRDEATVARAKDAIVRNADIQIQLIDDLLDLSRITSGKMRLEIRAVQMADVLRDAVDAVRPAADAKAIHLETTIAAAGALVAGDPARLQQVVWNLLLNAVKFTPRGGRVHLELRPGEPPYVEVVVRDTGEGIAPEILPYIFERFRQADSSSTRAHGGLGLGLALVRHLVELHGGVATAQSAGQGQGATFIVALPLASSHAPSGWVSRSSPTVMTASAAAPVVRLDGVRVLVVDDDRDAVALAQAILTNAGAEARACLSAADALQVLERWRPDVLVSDIEMPGEDGYALIRSVRALPGEGVSAIPAIALTAYGQPRDRLRAIAAGFNMHVPKPVDPGELTAIVASVTVRAD